MDIVPVIGLVAPSFHHMISGIVPEDLLKRSDR